jgi:hypothetical protein
MSHGHIRLTAVVALVLGVALRSGELVAMRLSHLRPEVVYVDRRPRGGGEPASAWFELSPIGAEALGRWLPLRKEFVDRTHGTSKLWVSLHLNHDGVLDADGQVTLQPAGVPLEDKGMRDSYAAGHVPYGLDKLPPKLEQLRRAVTDGCGSTVGRKSRASWHGVVPRARHRPPPSSPPRDVPPNQDSPKILQQRKQPTTYPGHPTMQPASGPGAQRTDPQGSFRERSDEGAAGSKRKRRAGRTLAQPPDTAKVLTEGNKVRSAAQNPTPRIARSHFVTPRAARG